MFRDDDIREIAVDLLDHSVRSSLETTDFSFTGGGGVRRRRTRPTSAKLRSSYTDDTLSEAPTWVGSPIASGDTSRSAHIRPQSGHSPLSSAGSRPQSAHSNRLAASSVPDPCSSPTQINSRRRRRSPDRMRSPAMMESCDKVMPWRREGMTVEVAGKAADGSNDNLSPLHDELLKEYGYLFRGFQPRSANVVRWIPTRRSGVDPPPRTPTPGPGHYYKTSKAVVVQDVANPGYTHPHYTRVLASKAKRFRLEPKFREISQFPAPCAYDVIGAAGSDCYAMRTQKHTSSPTAFFGTSKRLDMSDLHKILFVD